MSVAVVLFISCAHSLERGAQAQDMRTPPATQPFARSFKVMQSTIEFFGHASTSMTIDTNSCDNTSGKVVFSSHDVLKISKSFPKYNIQWETDEAKSIHKRVVATFDGQNNALVTSEFPFEPGKENMYLSHASPEWINLFYVCEMFGNRSFDDGKTSSEWLGEIQKAQGVHCTETIDLKQERVSVKCEWDAGHEIYELVDAKEGAGILSYEKTSGGSNANPTVSIKVTVTQWKFLDKHLIPTSINVNVRNSKINMTQQCVINEVKKVVDKNDAMFDRPHFDSIATVVDSDLHLAYSIKEGRKIYIPYLDPVTGQTINGPSTTTAPTDEKQKR